MAHYVSFIAEDTGSKIAVDQIDIFMDTHDMARAFGVQYADVYLVK